MNKIIPHFIATACLVVLVPAASACEPIGSMVDRHFDEVDANHDGAISRAEADAYHKKHFKEMDANHDGKITRAEMSAAEVKCHDQAQSGFKGQFMQRFDEVDINHDGALSKDEAEIGMPMVFKNFDEIDANHDGKVSKEELKAMMAIHHGSHHGGHPADKLEPMKPAKE